jgi:hypothetical protein
MYTSNALNHIRNSLKTTLINDAKVELGKAYLNNGMPKELVEQTINSQIDKIVQGADWTLELYDGLIYDYLVEKLGVKLEKSIKLNSVPIKSLYDQLSELISLNHIKYNSNIVDLVNYQVLIRRRILNEEIRIFDNEKELLINQEKALIKLSNIKATVASLIFVVILLCSVLFWCLLINKFGWSFLEPWTYISGLVLTVLIFLYYQFLGGKLNIVNFRKEIYKKALLQNYFLYKFNNKRLENLELLLKIKREELKEIEGKIQI